MYSCKFASLSTLAASYSKQGIVAVREVTPGSDYGKWSSDPRCPLRLGALVHRLVLHKNLVSQLTPQESRANFSAGGREECLVLP